jgi:D-alanyl-D-alanine carboxypeptidase (penicillin-binding protein 5/6)
MSAHIKDSCGPRKWGAAGETNQPHGRFTAKRTVLFALLAFFVFALIPLTASARKRPSRHQQPPPQGEDAVAAFIVKETGSSDFLKMKGIDRSLSPASLTKIMTCMLAIESGRMDDVVTIPLEATLVEPSRAGFKPGERVRLRDLVKAAMVNSSNDAAFAIAIHLGGSLNGFVATMNARARALGMSNTCFTNPAGYDRGIYAGNRTTARDMVLLTERAVRSPEFNAIAKMDRVVFSELSTGKLYSLSTHNKLLERYPYTVGIKTGYTSIAGPCLIARALKDGKDMLVILLHAKTDRWSLASSMFEEGFGGVAAVSSRPAVRVMEPVTVSRRVPRRKEAEPTPQTSASSVLAERNRALEALRRKVERQSAARAEEGTSRSRKDESSVDISPDQARVEKLKASLAFINCSRAGEMAFRSRIGERYMTVAHFISTHPACVPNC